MTQLDVVCLHNDTRSEEGPLSTKNKNKYTVGQCQETNSLFAIICVYVIIARVCTAHNFGNHELLYSY